MRRLEGNRLGGVRPGVAGALAALLLVAGCGAGNDRRDIRATVMRFARATAAKDYQTLCQSVLAPSVTEPLQQVGLPCEQALQKGLGRVRNPQLAIRRIDILGSAALAVVHTTASNQPASDDTIQLVKVAGAWRVSSLAQPRGGAGSATPAAISTATARPTPQFLR